MARLTAALQRNALRSEHRPSVGRRIHVARPHHEARTAIVGGSAATTGTFGFMAYVAHYDASGNQDFACSGTIISPTVVLTAGHCTIDESTGGTLEPAGFRVITGSVDWTMAAPSQVSQVAGVITNPSYDNTTNTSDAGVLILANPTRAPSIQLATPADQILEQPGTRAFIAGWGDTSANQTSPQTALQWATTVVQDPTYCGQYNGSYNATVELCTVNVKTFDTGTCTGDSGGPLIAPDSKNNPIEIGITSTGPPNCDTTSADYFTSVDPLYDWARRVIQAAAPAPPPQAPAPAPTRQPTLPRMTATDARGYVRQVLEAILPNAFRRRHNYKTQCSRSTAIKISCGITFWQGPNDFWGVVTPYYYAGTGNSVAWNATYTLHWVNDHCYRHTHHRSTCTVRNRKGIW